MSFHAGGVSGEGKAVQGNCRPARRFAITPSGSMWNSRSLPETWYQPIRDALGVVTIGRELAREKPFFECEPYHQEGERNDREQRSGVRSQPETEPDVHQWASGVHRMSDDAVDPGRHHRVLALSLEADHHRREGIGRERERDDRPTQYEQTETKSRNRDRWT